MRGPASQWRTNTVACQFQPCHSIVIGVRDVWILLRLEFVAGNLQVGKRFVAVANEPAMRQPTAFLRPNVAEINLAWILIVGHLHFDTDQISLGWIEVEAGFDTAVHPDEA